MDKFRKIIKIEKLNEEKYKRDTYKVFFEDQQQYELCSERMKHILELEDALYRTGLSSSMQKLLSEYKEAASEYGFKNGYDSGFDAGLEEGISFTHH